MTAPLGYTLKKDAQGTRFYARDYGSGAQLAAYAQARDGWKSGHGRTWTFGDTGPEETRDALARGEVPPVIAEKIDALRGAIETAMEAHDSLGISARRRFRFADQGDEIDADRLNIDHPHPFRESRRGKQARVIRFGFNIALSNGNKQEAFHGLAATACAVADALQARGFASEIVAFSATCRGEEWSVGHWTIKQASEPLDLGRIAAPGLPGVMRHAVLVDLEAWDCSGGLCDAAPAHVREYLGVDYVLAQSWVGQSQQRIAEGVREIIEAK